MNTHAIQEALDAAYAAHASCSEGHNASYIPALAQVDASLFGLAAVTVEGKVLTVGDAQKAFAIESIAKAFNLSLVMDCHGPAELRRKIGAESTGEPFNSVMALELHRGKPLNPLVNAGAMAAVSLVPGADADAVWQNIVARFAALAGRELLLMEAVYQSESVTNAHNKGIAWLLKSYGYLYNEPGATVDLYTRMCSLAVNTRELATMGACYAAGGVNPLTGRRVCKKQNVPEILADMAMEGMYTESGDWFYANGLPAKSGVGGGIVCVVPGRMALAAYSPPLDAAGNSVRGQRALTDIIARLGLNPLAS